jgi:hypothetical protein
MFQRGGEHVFRRDGEQSSSDVGSTRSKEVGAHVPQRAMRHSVFTRCPSLHASAMLVRAQSLLADIRVSR